jgi:hypothetical protein
MPDREVTFNKTSDLETFRTPIKNRYRDDSQSNVSPGFTSNQTSDRGGRNATKIFS